MDLTLRPVRFASLQQAPVSAPHVPAFSSVRPQSGPAKDVFFGSKKPPYTDFDLVNRLVTLGTDPQTKNKVGFRVSRHFSTDGTDHDTTYGKLLDETRRSAAGFAQMGLSGKRIAVAETNTLDFLSTWYGALGVGATVLPVNLLAMQDENSKIAKLMHMVAAPESDAFVIGADPLFKPMLGFQKILSLKKPVLRSVAQRFADGKPPRKNILDGLLYKKLNHGIEEKVAAGVATLQKKDVEVTPNLVEELRAQAKSDFATLYNALPAKIKLVTPEAKAKFSTGKPMSLDQLVSKPDPDAIADIIFTSGTSGNPKGVALSHKNLNFTTQSLSVAMDELLKPDDVMLLGLPLFHIFGQAVMLTGVNRGVPLVMLPSLRDALADLPSVAKTIHEYNITVLPAVPVFLEKVVAEAAKNPVMADAVKKLRVIISGGAPLKRATYDALKALNPDLRIIEGYGSSEAGINLFNMAGEPGYVGHELPGVQVKMIENQEGHAMYGYSKSEGEGEILVKSPGISVGYVASTIAGEDPAKVKNGLVPLTDDKGWYHTGDQGRRHRVLKEGAVAGSPGSLTLAGMQIIGRESNFIKDSGGERRDPSEFENAVRFAEPKVLDAMAVTYKPDRETEKSVVVAVTEDPNLTEADIKATMGALVPTGQLAGALIPKHIIVLNRSSLPEAFKNDFKREAGYKVAKDFVKKTIANGLIELHDKSASGRERTEQPDPKALAAFAESYKFSEK